MIAQRYSRSITFEKILNFRDLGGYKARGGRTIAWRRLFRSGEMHLMTENDAKFLKEKLKVKTVIDLRSASRLEKTGRGRLSEANITCYSVPFSLYAERNIDQNILLGFTNAAESYLYRIITLGYGKQIIDTLEIIAMPENLPLVFHCNAGKDRSGMVAAILLSVLGVAEEDIIADYVLTAQSLKEFILRWDNDPETAHVHKNLLDWDKEIRPDDITLFLAGLKKEYGSIPEFLENQRADSSLLKRLQKALLV